MNENLVKQEISGRCTISKNTYTRVCIYSIQSVGVCPKPTAFLVNPISVNNNNKRFLSMPVKLSFQFANSYSISIIEDTHFFMSII